MLVRADPKSFPRFYKKKKRLAGVVDAFDETLRPAFGLVRRSSFHEGKKK